MAGSLRFLGSCLCVVLTGNYRQVLDSGSLVDLQVEEIASLLEIPGGTVKCRTHLALQAPGARDKRGVAGMSRLEKQLAQIVHTVVNR